MATPPMPSKFSVVDSQSKEAASFVNKAALAAMVEWKALDPATRSKMEVKPMCFVYKSGGVGFFNLIHPIMDALLLPNGLNKTQKEILAEVQKEFPQFKLNANLWNRKLSSPARTKAQARIEGRMAQPVSIRGCETLAQVRKRLVAKGQPKKDAVTFKGEITFTKTHLHVGSKSYAYVERGATPAYYVNLPLRKSGKRSWVRVSALVELFAPPRKT